jgi:Actinobacteria/chloroflexi VLRF1 release factor
VSRPPAPSRTVQVGPERLARWLDGFAARHGAVTWDAGPDLVTVRASDGAVAEVHVPFPPLPEQPGSPYGGIVPHALRDRRVGVLLVRLGGHAAGVFEGSTLRTSKVGSRQVHGRSAAGGWSQQRFARRREGQVRVALGAAADVAARVLLPEVGRLEGLVTGGDRRALDTVLEDPRLAALRPLVTGVRLDVPDPRLKVLQATPAHFRAVQVHVVDPV